MCEFVVNSFPFEIIMMGTAARRAGEPFVQQFLDKHSRSCWRRPTRCALFLHRTTPTRPEISRADVAFVCAALPATPYFSVGPRQRGPTFPRRTPPLFAPPFPTTPCFSIGPRQHDPDSPGRTPPLLASPSPLCLISSSRHANTVWKFPDMLTYLGARKLKERDSLQ